MSSSAEELHNFLKDTCRFGNHSAEGHEFSRVEAKCLKALIKCLSIAEFSSAIDSQQQQELIRAFGFLVTALECRGTLFWKKRFRRRLKSHGNISSVLAGHLEKLHATGYAPLNFLTLCGSVTELPASCYSLAAKLLVDNFVSHSDNVPSNSTVSCLCLFLSRIPRLEFENVLLPAIERALLRNAETVLGYVTSLICATEFEITSPLAKRLCSAFGSYFLCSMDQKRAEFGRRVFEHLQKFCQDAASADIAAQYILSSVNGELPEARLVNSEQRTRALTMLAFFSFGNTTPEMAIQVLTILKPLIKSEANEAIAVELVLCYTRWLVSTHEPLSPEKVSFLKSVHSAKSSGPLLRAAVINCVTMTEDNTAMATSFVDVIAQTFTKTKGHIAQPSSCIELFTAAQAALKLIVFDSKLEGKLKVVWENLLDVAVLNQLVNEKFYSSCHVWGFSCVLKAIESIFVRFPNRIEHVVKQFSYPFAIALCHSSKVVRELSLTLFERIFNRSQLAFLVIKNCLDELPDILSIPHLPPSELTHATVIRRRENHRELTSLFKLLNRYLFTVARDKDSKINISLSVLRLACSSHLCVYLTPKVICRRFFIALFDNPDKFLKENVSDLLTSVHNNFNQSATRCAAIAVLLEVAGSSSVSQLVSLLVKVFANPVYSQVTKEEVDVLNTPTGEICDQKALEAIVSADKGAGNMKRESKAYSYRDQKMEMELRKELIAKNMKNLQKLAPAQQTKVNALLKQESEIRDRLTAEVEKFEREAAILNYLLNNKHTSDLIRLFAWKFISALQSLFSSRLVGTKASNLFMTISKSVFNELSFLGLTNCISTAYLRTYNSVVEFSKPWSTLTASEHYSKFANSLVEADHLDAAQFSFTFPLVNHLIRQKDLVSNEDSFSLMSMLHTRFTSYDPKSSAFFLPRKDFLDLIVFMLDGGLIPEETASTVLIDLCRTNFLIDDGDYFDEEIAEQLIKLILHRSPLCRRIVLKAFNKFGDFISPVHDFLSVEFFSALLIETFDADDKSRELASNVWTHACDSPPILPEFVQPTLREVQAARTSELREACASALAAIVSACPALINSVMLELFAIYRRCLPSGPKMDEFGRPIVLSQAVQEQHLEFQVIRLSIAACFDKLAHLIPLELLDEMFQFLIPTPLADPYEPVRDRMLTAATALLSDKGPDVVDVVYPVTENFLRSSPIDDASLDPARQATVVLTATVARHLPKDDARVRVVMQKLTETLSTPSEPVQIAVANSMAPLVRSIAKDELPSVVENLLKVLFEAETFAERRGAAYGLASIVKGHGIVALKQFELTSQLQTAIEDKKNMKKREGALFAHEIMCRILGVIFEPHIISFLPYLLTSFGDSQQNVRLAADDCAKEIMSKLTGHGIKLVLPMLLEGLKSEQWRTKCASAELLGAMAYCAPRQLSACLPTIVPLLMETVNDSHSKVQKGGENALRNIQSVIKNPEILQISGIIVEALLNPLEKSARCLKTLSSTRLVHRLDAPSLALIMPVVQRALLERHTEPRKFANQLITSVNTQTNTNDFEPYIPSLLPGIKQSLLDPAPDVRLVASKALGAVSSCLGPDHQQELLPWLLEILVSETSSANRSGAAQGLCEVVKVMGVVKLEQLVRDAVTVSKRSDIPSATRDGYLLLFVFLPPVFGDDFAPHVITAIPAILRGLSDESEVVRETALRAGQRIIQLYSQKAQELFVPELEKGLIHENWRIRYSSVILLSEFLFKVADITGKMTSETAHDDDTFGSDKHHQKISDVIGKLMSHRVLAGLYLLRQDVALVVRQASVHAWKLIVPNTPKILREISPALMETIVNTFSSRNTEKIQIAQRTLGDIVRKLGDRMLNEVILYLGKVLSENRPSDEATDEEKESLEMKREAVCHSFNEVIINANKDLLQAVFKNVSHPIMEALLDESPAVRELAAQAFSSLHSIISTQAITDIVTPLCDPTKLTEEQAEYALDSLAQIMTLKSKHVLPTLLPHLLQPIPNTKALAMISEVAGEAIGKSIGIIIPALLDAVTTTRKMMPEKMDTCLEECQTVMLSVEDEDIARQILQSLLAACTPDNEQRCLSALSLLAYFLEEADLEVSDHAMAVFKTLLLLCRSENVALLDLTWVALDVMVSKRMAQEDYLSNMNYLRQIVHTAIGNSKPPLPGFVLSKKAVAPILPVYRDCLLSGSPTVKEMAANGLEEIVKYSSSDTLKSQVINITGPLIRVLGDRFGPNVKVAILGALDALLQKCGPLLKPFIPQLQTTFNKCLIDTQTPIRQRCSLAYGGLAAIHMRPENLLNDLTNLVKSNADEAGVRESILVAIRRCIMCLGRGRCPDAGAAKLTECILSTFANTPDITTRQAGAGCIGCLLAVGNDSFVEDTVKNSLISFEGDWVLVHFKILCLQPLLAYAPERLEDLKLMKETTAFAKKCMESSQVIMKSSASRLCYHILRHDISEKNSEVDPEVTACLVQMLKAGSNEAREAMATLLFKLGVEIAENEGKLGPSPKLISEFIPQLVMGSKEKHQGLRRACEYALVELLLIRKGMTVFNSVSECLDTGMRDTLRDSYNRYLKKLSEQPSLCLTVMSDETLLEH